jgi:uncharacterized protein DUF4339
MTTYWHCRIAGQDLGPYTADQLTAFAREGRISPLDFVRESNGSNWQPASQLAWLAFPPSLPTGSSAAVAPNSALARSTEPSTVAVWVLVGMAAIAAVCVGIFALLLFTGAAGSAGDNRGSTPHSVGVESPHAVPTARLHISGHDATSELQGFVAGLSAEQRALLGFAALATGNDIYAAEIRITNTGSLPIHVFPENLTIHYGTDATTVSTYDHPRFLQTCMLQPGQYTQGLVLYQARIDVGAAMRLRGGTFAYNDPTIEVEYGR